MSKVTLARPQSIAEVAREATDSGDFATRVAEFLDEFYASPSRARITEEPPKVSGDVEESDVMDVYLAAIAEYLADRNNFSCPEWAENRSLRHPHFAHPSEHLRALLLVESPPAFRKRNLFVSENAMSRA